MPETGNNKTKQTNNTLSIRSKPDGFVFYALHQQTQAYFELVLEKEADLREVFTPFVQEKGWWQQPDWEVVIYEDSPRYTLLPVDIQSPSNQQAFFNMLFDPDPNRTLHSFILSDGIQRICTDPFSERIRLFEEAFSHFTLHSAQQQALEWLLHQAKTQNKTHLLAEIQGQSLFLSVANEERWLLTNAFNVENEAEMHYFILRCMEQLDLDPFETRCLLRTEKNRFERLRSTLGLFIQHIVQVELAMPDNRLRIL